LAATLSAASFANRAAFSRAVLSAIFFASASAWALPSIRACSSALCFFARSPLTLIRSGISISDLGFNGSFSSLAADIDLVTYPCSAARSLAASAVSMAPAIKIFLIRLFACVATADLAAMVLPKMLVSNMTLPWLSADAPWCWRCWRRSALFSRLLLFVRHLRILLADSRAAPSERACCGQVAWPKPI